MKNLRRSAEEFNGLSRQVTSKLEEKLDEIIQKVDVPSEAGSF